MTDHRQPDPHHEALAWLYGQRRDGRARDPRVARELLNALEIPDPARVIHVVGTNGKGTVSHMLAAMAQAEGFRVGRFTSPHVEDFCERIAVDSALVDPSRVAAFVEAVRSQPLSGIGFFEWTLALALSEFARAGVDLVVLEAGVGARHDATLAVGGVVGSVLTNVGLDHLETLGPTLEDIARDKSAVARPGIPLVTAAEGAALRVIEEHAMRVSAPLDVVTADHPLGRLPDGVNLDGPATRHENARLALALGRRLGWREASLRRGVLAAPPPGRFERFTLHWRGGTVPAILDGAHDPTATARLRPDLPERYVLLFAQLERKRSLATLQPLLGGASQVVWTRADAFDTDPSTWVQPPPKPPIHIEGDPERALARACDLAHAAALPLVVAGSLHLAGEMRPRLRALSAQGAGTEAGNAAAMLGG